MRVLLAHDSSAHSQAASNYLLSMPFREPLEVDVVSAVSPPMLVDSGTIGLPPDLSSFIAEECAAVESRVEDAAQHLRTNARSVNKHIPVGPPSSELLHVADQTETDLIVMGAVGHSALQRVLLGSVSDYVATHADVSALVVRPPRDSEVQPELKRIVLALSGNAQDERMVNWLRHLNWSNDVEVHLVRILQLPTLYRQDIRQKAQDSWDNFVRDAQTQILELETTLLDLGFNTETHLVEAEHIGEAVIDYAEEHGADLIVTGDSDSSLLTRVFLGSTSRYVLRHAQCSVLVVRDRKDRLEAKREAAAEAQAKFSAV